MARPSKDSSEEIINHFGMIRLRVTGVGNLRPTFWSLSNFAQDALVSMPMSLETDTEPDRLANFTKHRARLELRTININEEFKISKIVIFIKPVAKSFPSTT